jgi:hypothetical protein
MHLLALIVICGAVSLLNYLLSKNGVGKLVDKMGLKKK